MSSAPASRARAGWTRAALYFVLWLLLLPSAKAADVGLGLATAAAAAWISLRLSPPETGGVRIGALLLRMPAFLWASVRAGIDVARRAFAPSLPLKPGFVIYPTALPNGHARNGFTSIASLLPGTVATGSEGEAVCFHALDVSQPVVEQLREDELRYAPALVVGQGDG
jgi:multicomponent Na+:H+ antiporter subunit E